MSAHAHVDAAGLAGSQIWRNGELIPAAEATVHVLSHPVARGSQVFDVLRVVNPPSGPAALGLRPHVARFERSMRLMGMEVPYRIAALEAAVAETVLANPGAEVVKVMANWDEIANGTVPVTTRPTIYISAVPLTGDAGVATAPVRLATAEMPKMPAEILPPSLKVAAAYTAAIRAQLTVAGDSTVDDVIFRTMRGRLAEGTSQSMLAVRGDRVLAPSLDTVLDGITRRLLLDLVEGYEYGIEIRDVFWDEVAGADELVLTSTNGLVRPVAALDHRTLRAPGPLATALTADLNRLVAGDHPLSVRWLTPLTVA